MVIKRKRTMPIKRLPVAIEHSGFYPYLLKYFESIKLRGYSDSTLHRRESDIRRFIGWCDTRSLTQPNQVTKPILEQYQRYLFYYRQENDKPLGVRTQNNYVTSVRQLFKWLTQQNYLLYNPASELILMKQPSTLPIVLSEAEIDKLLQQPDIRKASGLRDRAMMELLYSTGIRRSECCHLELQDISADRQTLYVRKGKGNKDRLIPIGDRAMYWLSRYLTEVRNQFLMDIQQTTLFLNDYGDEFRDTKLGDKVKKYMRHADINVPGSCHLLRHAMATHMMENGAELRYIQAMLGHADLSSTQIYTHVSIRRLQEVHSATHPAKIKKSRIE